MDNLTHALASGALCALIAPPGRRRAALLVGAVLGNVPDIDVFWPYPDPVAAFSEHRGPTHSLFVLPFVALLAWLVLRWRWSAVREAPWRWLVACVLAACLHPLLDAFTVYGTQLFWPLDRAPTMWSSIFIIDPLFTLPLLVGFVLAWRLRERARAGFWLGTALAASALYLGWTLLAKHTLESGVRAGLAQQGHGASQVLTVPTPLNSVLWRIVVMRSDGRQFYEGYHSFLSGATTPLDPYVSQPELLDPLLDAPAVRRLQWFTSGWLGVSEEDGKVLMTDLRMGAHPDYVFRFVVGERRDGRIAPVDPPQQLPWPAVGWDSARRVWARASGG